MSLSVCPFELAQAFSHLALLHPMGIEKEGGKVNRNSPSPCKCLWLECSFFLAQGKVP